MSQNNAVRESLLDLHKALIDAVRIEYERVHGRVETAGALLQLVTSDPAFEWLRPFSRLIVDVDQLEPDAGPGPIGEMVQALFERDGEFARAYQDRLQSSPDVVMRHLDAMTAVRALRSGAAAAP